MSPLGGQRPRKGRTEVTYIAHRIGRSVPPREVHQLVVHTLEKPDLALSGVRRDVKVVTSLVLDVHLARLEAQQWLIKVGKVAYSSRCHRFS